VKPRWFSWKPKGLEKFDCRQKYDRAPTPDEVIIAIEVKGHMKGRGVGTFAARFLFRREQLEKERPTVDAVMVEAFAKKWLGALVGTVTASGTGPAEPSKALTPKDLEALALTYKLPPERTETSVHIAKWGDGEETVEHVGNVVTTGRQVGPRYEPDENGEVKT
jgi:hypothetical protein